MASGPEGKVKAAVRALLNRNSSWAFMPVSNGMGRMGIPDIIACIPVVITQEMVGKTIGCFAGIETKAPGKIKSTTPNQEKELLGIFNASGVAIVADNTDIVADSIAKLRHGDATYSVPGAVKSGSSRHSGA